MIEAHVRYEMEKAEPIDISPGFRKPGEPKPVQELKVRWVAVYQITTLGRSENER